MASDSNVYRSPADEPAARSRSKSGSSVWRTIVWILTPVASLRLTVVLFVMAIFIVFVGTLAQTEKDIWQVIHEYFRMDLGSIWSTFDTAFAWIDFRVLFPAAFFPNMKPLPHGFGFWFPSGWLIGFVMFMNLTAAHLIRFRVQARGARLGMGLVVTAIGTALLCVVIAAGSRQTADRLPLFADWPSLRILWLLTQCTVVSVVLLIGCVLVFHKRAGIVLLHLGVGLLMLGELLVGVGAVESQMQIVEGRTVNYVLDTRELELAVVDPSDDEVDDVVVIPQSRLRPGETVSDSHLPFDVEIVRFMQNSRRPSASENIKNLATAGMGLGEVLVGAAPVNAMGGSGQTNHPALYARIREKNSKQAGDVYLLSQDHWFRGMEEKVPCGGKQYELSLRYKHMYKPYSMHLIDVRMDRYMGTQTAKSYSSEIRLVDPSHNVDRKVRIWMNNPLRYAGETFYQSSYGRDPKTGTEYTALQVVTNTGWRIPYLACMMVSVGMLAQFWLTLTRFLRRRESARQEIQRTGSRQLPPGHAPARKRRKKPPAPETTPPPDSGGSIFDWAVPVAVVALCACWLLSKAYTPAPKESAMDLNAFGRLPVMYEGRIKPFDTLARNSLRIISDKQSFKNLNDKKQPAVKWLLDVITDTNLARQHRVFRIHHLQVLETLGLQPRQGFRYSIDEFSPQLVAFDQQVQRARATNSDELDLYGRKILELDRKLNLYLMLREAFRPPQLRPDHVKQDLAAEMNRRRMQSQYSLPLAVPPADGRKDWQAYTYAVFDAMAERVAGKQPNPTTAGLAAVLNSYATGDATAFNRDVAEYHQQLRNYGPAQWRESKTDFESFFNHFSPSFYAMILYVFAFILVCLSWLGWSKPLNRAAFGLIVFTLVAHTFALCGRMYISGRPPITNLYSSAIFVGWGCVILGLILERVYKIGVGNVIAAVSGFGTLLIAFLLTTAVPSFKGDSFTVLVAVLDTQFWLATHVTCITLGYSTTFVAGLLGIVYVLRGVLTPSLSPRIGKEISRMIYGTICFAIFFSFFGTVLGGLWADDSWGRFWGWDPKENGALIIVLWNAVVLHTYWSRIVRERGLAVMSVIGNVVTSWSWFGVNELRVGLHTYGFTEGVLLILATFVGSQLLIVAIGLIPKDFWWSNRENGANS